MAESRTLDNLRDVRDHLVAWNKVQIGTPDRIAIDNEIVPILKFLIREEFGTQIYRRRINLLFKWFSKPKRTADEFMYVLGPLAKHVADIMGSEPSHSDEINGYPPIDIVLVRLAAEAFPVLCPTLEGTWEHVAWFMITINSYYTEDGNEGNVSDQLSCWIIHVIGNPDICPNPNLRTSLLRMFLNMVEVNDENRALALQSVMSACSSLHMEHEKESQFKINPSHISRMISMLGKKKYLQDFDKALSKKLQRVRTSGLSDILHDVSYALRINPNRYKEPIEICGIVALLKTLAGYAQQLYRKVSLDENSSPCHMSEAVILFPICTEIINTFKFSCQSFQMKEVTAEFIIDVFEMGFCFLPWAFSECEKILVTLFTGRGFDKTDFSPIAQVILKDQRKRILGLGGRFNNRYSSLINDYPMLRGLLYHKSTVVRGN